MIRSHLRTLTVAAVAAALGATLVFTVSPSSATAELRAAPRTMIGAVEVDAKLTQTADGWAIDVEATNPTDAEQPCKVALALTRFVNNPMSRVRAMPSRAWESLVALEVPAHGRVQRRVELPANVAAGLTAVEVKPAKADTLPVGLASTVEYAVVVSSGAAKAAAVKAGVAQLDGAALRLANAAD